MTVHKFSILQSETASLTANYEFSLMAKSKKARIDFNELYQTTSSVC